MAEVLKLRAPLSREKITLSFMAKKMKTRAGEKSDLTATHIEAKIQMGSISPTPLKLIVLPKDIGSEARICTFAHPRTSNPSRYYFCPERGIFEFIRIAAPKSVCQSWLVGPRRRSCHDADSTRAVQPMGDQEEIRESSVPIINSTGSVAEGYVMKSPELFVATPIDPLFIALPSFCRQFSSGKGASMDSRFVSIDDLIERLQETSRHLELLSKSKCVQETFKARIIAVSDTVVAGDETMYRINLDKLLTELVLKAKNIVSSGFPATMEENFIHRALEVPMIGLKREEISLLETPKLSQEDKSISEHVSSDCESSQKTISTINPTLTASTTTSNLSVPDTNDPLTQDLNVEPLLRLRTALSYMISSYVPLPIENALNEKLASSNSPIDFKPLDVRLAHIANLRAEALASRSLADFSRKRSMNEDDEAVEARAEKKQRKEDEEKRRKASESRGVRDLKKVDVSGMKKMSDFFAKGPSKKT